MVGLVDGNNFFVSCERVFNRRLVGRPVAVLSNNDGCCVARSNELKALGVKMGTPYFELKHREAAGELVCLSSNYELYGDMSRRMISILRDNAQDVEQYSIDEAFIRPRKCENLEQWGTTLRSKILDWIGIPCGIGFAPTKTLAKIANHIAKKREIGVSLLPEKPGEILAGLPVNEVWGVGRRLVEKLRSERIFTAAALRDAHDDVLRRIGGVTLLRTAQELRGIPSDENRDYDADPASITCSRSFGTPVADLDGIVESLSSFVSQAAEKLRRYSMLAGGCNIYAQIFRSGGGGEIFERTVAFPSPTDATNEMIEAMLPAAKQLYMPGARYRKTGVMFFGLEKVGRARQLDLFKPNHDAKPSPLYAAVDHLNARFGKRTVFSAAEGIGPKSWHVKRDKISPHFTTSWNEIPVVV